MVLIEGSSHGDTLRVRWQSAETTVFGEASRRTGRRLLTQPLLVAHSRKSTGTVCDLPPKVVLTLRVWYREGRSARTKKRSLIHLLVEVIDEVPIEPGW